MTQAEDKTQTDQNPENKDGDGGNSASNASKSSESKQFMTGLQFAAFFFLGFALLGYPIPLSVVMGVVGGTASGWIATWWHTDDQLEEEAHLLDDELGGTIYSSRASMRKLRQQRYLSSRNRYRNRRNRSLLSWFFETGGGR
ncbi:hypothetical protein IQ235_14190 [Oscillatoriales cyanobacterium LEGE 11467]|uniref:Uncharacterized protein n=1 Tax=Zarconia navalis LEGE 11467 TaxID=1828826 RepID=A0A928VX69_9CYAN|nr:hypothetical protein [Zarconia navalis]MBE9041929.1 hypothetical protein [Zarconia navalis LEGE 11467]